jgi:hypothetical protein
MSFPTGAPGTVGGSLKTIGGPGGGALAGGSIICRRGSGGGALNGTAGGGFAFSPKHTGPNLPSLFSLCSILSASLPAGGAKSGNALGENPCCTESGRVSSNPRYL